MLLKNIAAILFLANSAIAAAQLSCRAIDGDTIACGAERIRLIGVYAAERGDRGGEAARRRLQSRLDAGRLEIRRRGRDRYGRTLAEVYVAGQRITQRDIGRPAGRGR